MADADLDSRLNAFREDLADARLQGRVTAARFVSGEAVQVLVPVTPVHRRPQADAMQLTQALMGQTALRFEDADGWSWVQFDADGYVGYVPSRALTADVSEATHVVTAASTFIYPRADLKSVPAIAIPRGARLRITGVEGKYAALATGGFVIAAHAAPLGHKAEDFVAVAEQFLHTPYLWGGKTAHGIDCSGLVQVALHATGQACPRDSDMQEKALGTQLMINDLAGLQRGDLVFWKGHVGIMADSTTLLHANGHHMSTVKEPLAEVVQRTLKDGLPVTSLKRLG